MVAYFNAFVDGVSVVYIPREYLKQEMLKAQRLQLHCPKILQSGDDLTYAKKETQADPLALTFDRVPIPVEYIRGPVE